MATVEEGLQAQIRNIEATVASGMRCKSDGRGSGFMVMLGDSADISGTVVVLGVRVNFVGNQDRLAGSAGQAADVWLRGA